MTYQPRPWAESEDRMLMISARKKLPIATICRRVDRPEHAVKRRAIALRIPLDYLNKKD